jgi:hypothetical protein
MGALINYCHRLSCFIFNLSFITFKINHANLHLGYVWENSYFLKYFLFKNILKYYFFYFLKIIFKINVSKYLKISKKKINLKQKKINFFLNSFETQKIKEPKRISQNYFLKKSHTLNEWILLVDPINSMMVIL